MNQTTPIVVNKGEIHNIIPQIAVKSHADYSKACQVNMFNANMHFVFHISILLRRTLF